MMAVAMKVNTVVVMAEMTPCLVCKTLSVVFCE